MKNNFKESISWMNGHWGGTNEISIPISDRGLNLGDGIFETILRENQLGGFTVSSGVLSFKLEWS